MATRYVDKSAGSGGDGSVGSPWNSLTTADNNCSPGDTIRVKPGKYPDDFKIFTQNTTWEAFDPANRPVIDGGYHVGLKTKAFDGQKDSMPWPTNTKNGINIRASGVTVDGFVVQNINNDGINIAAPNTTLRNCVTYFCYTNGIISNNVPNCVGVTIEDCEIYLSSIRYLAGPANGGPAGDAGKQGGAGMMMRDMKPPFAVRRLRLAYCFGEGLDIGKGSVGTQASPLIFEDMECFDCNHVPIYIDRAAWIVVRNCVSYFTDVGVTVHGGTTEQANTCFRIKDESTNDGVPTRDVQVYNCIFVNGGSLIEWGGDSGGTNMNSGARTTNTRNTYFGAITAVCGPNASKRQVNIGANTGFSQEGILENIIVDNTYGTTVPLSKVSGTVRVTCRNNVWHTDPEPYFRNSTNKIGNPGLVNPNKRLITSNYPSGVTQDFANFSASNNFDPNDYKITSGSRARDAGSQDGPSQGTSIPPLARSEDYFHASRSGVPDIGAVEYGGGAPPTGTVTADFTYTPASGDAGVSIAFTNTSSVTGSAVINKRTWNFGDGTTSTAVSPTHVYGTPGTYTVRLLVEDTVAGLSSEKFSAPIVISSPPTGGAGGVKFGQVTVSLPATAPSSVDVVSPEMGAIVPGSARVYITQATADGVAVDGEMLSVGWATGGNYSNPLVPTAYVETAVKHGVATSAAKSFSGDGTIGGYVDPVTGAYGSIFFENWIPGGMRIRIESNAPPSPGLRLTAVFAGGPQYKARIAKVIPGAIGAKDWWVSGGFPAHTVRFMATGSQPSVSINDSVLSFGYVHPPIDLEDYHAVCVMRVTRGGQTPGTYTASITQGEVLKLPVSTGYSTIRIMSMTDAFGVLLEVIDQPMNTPIYMMFESYGSSKSEVGLTKVNDAANTLGWKPQYVEHLMLWKANTSLSTNNRAGTIGTHLRTAANERTVMISGNNNASPSNVQSITSPDALIVNNIGTVVAEGSTALNPTGYSFLWSGTTPTENFVLPFIAVEEGKESGGGAVTANFSAAPTSGISPLTVQFTNLSSAAATTYSWDFGDGQVSSLKDPVHIYEGSVDSPYTVTLTVSNGVNSDTITKTAYITVEPPIVSTGIPFVIGPYRFRMVAGILSPVVHDAIDDDDAGLVELPLGNMQNAMYLKERDTPPVVRPGYTALWINSGTGQIEITRG